jgi:hypothetical protein
MLRNVSTYLPDYTADRDILAFCFLVLGCVISVLSQCDS